MGEKLILPNEIIQEKFASFVRLAAEGHRRVGRGAVFVLLPKFDSSYIPGSEKLRVFYLGEEDDPGWTLVSKSNPKIIKLIERYDPNKQFVLSITDLSVSRTSNYLLRLLRLGEMHFG